MSPSPNQDQTSGKFPSLLRIEALSVETRQKRESYFYWLGTHLFSFFFPSVPSVSVLFFLSVFLSLSFSCLSFASSAFKSSWLGGESSFLAFAEFTTHIGFPRVIEEKPPLAHHPTDVRSAKLKLPTLSGLFRSLYFVGEM